VAQQLRSTAHHRQKSVAAACSARAVS